MDPPAGDNNLRKILDQTYNYPVEHPPKATAGRYRLRIYTEDGVVPAVVASDLEADKRNVAWLAGHAPHLAGSVARDHLPDCQALRWITQYYGEADADLFEVTHFAVLVNRQVACRDRPRPSASLPIQPQSTIQTRSDVEVLLGEKLD